MKHFKSLILALVVVGSLTAPCFAPVGANVEISVTKRALDADGVLFDFSGETFEGFLDFELQDGQTQTWSFPTAHKTQFEVREFLPEGWKLTDIIVDVMYPEDGWGDIDLSDTSVMLNIDSSISHGDIAFDVTFVNERMPVIPAPAALALAAIGAGAAGWLRRRKTI